MKNCRILIVLGGQNDESGKLSSTALSRADACVDIYREGDIILCTGGWGEHFNRTEKSHAYYLKKYLIKQGIEESEFLPFALSSNTVEDAVKVKEITEARKQCHLVVITSAFHMERAKLIFCEILADYSIAFHESEDNMEYVALEKALEHEAYAIRAIKEKGLYY